ncbi:MAG: glycosyltransferase family 2 protein [Acidobacteria bacterium]|nr:MAG: glycosyltransferase family 2 protein [Acidobacteriota bacterium]
MTDLVIVIVSYNARTDLEACLASLAEPQPTTRHEIVVVDNASSDGSAEVARARRPTVTVIDAGDNLGFARATNLGIRATASQLVLLLNSDTLPPPGAIDRLVEILLSRPDVAIVGPRLVDAHGALEVSFGSMISPFAELWQTCLVRGHARRTPLLASLVERRARTERRVDWVSGACLLVRRAAAEAAGLLDERFFLYGEDVDFCATVRGFGRHVLYTPAVEVVHHRGRSWQSAPASAATASRRSHLAFYRKHHPAWHPVLRAYLRVRGTLPAGE